MKCQINKIQLGEKQWIEVIFQDGLRWIPSFEELGKITHLIGQCEDEKYPNGKGAEMVKDFLENAVLTGMTYEEYCNWKKIPKRISN
tara:strand:- start:1299 stop:1559 length:261 start_codon:yes stop_codon:yes gene_type:complete